MMHYIFPKLAALLLAVSLTGGPGSMARIAEKRSQINIMNGDDTLTGGVFNTFQIPLPNPNLGQQWDISLVTFDFRTAVLGASFDETNTRTQVIGAKFAIVHNGMELVLATQQVEYGTGPTLIFPMVPSDGGPAIPMGTVNYGSPFTLLPRDQLFALISGNFAGGDGSLPYQFQLMTTISLLGTRSPSSL